MKATRIEASASLDDRVHLAADRALAENQKTIRVPEGSHRRRILMKTRITGIAAAAVVAIVATVAILPMLDHKVTFAEVIEPILRARTLAFDFVIGDESTGPVMHDVVVGSRVRRTFSNMPIIMIIDVDSARMLALDPTTNSAGYVNIGNQTIDGTESVLDLVRNVLTKIEAKPDKVRDLGRSEIDGVEVVGYLVEQHEFTLKIWADANKAEQHEFTLKIWADANKARPVRIELHGHQFTATLKNIVFDLEVDESLVSMDVPAGYTLDETEHEMRDPTEEDFVESLRIWAHYLNDGVFPDELTLEACMEQMPRLGETLVTLGLSDAEQTRIGLAWGTGMGFLQKLSLQGRWEYTGKGVSLGDAATVIFRYRRGDSPTARAIYGDLRVEDAPVDGLPQ
jgi:hypothetical protein